MVGTSVATFCAGASHEAQKFDATSLKEVLAGRLVAGDMLVAAVGG